MYEELTSKVEKKLKLVAIQQACIDCTLHYIKRLVVDLSTKPKCDSMLALLKRYDKLGCVATAGKYKWKIKDLLKELNISSGLKLKEVVVEANEISPNQLHKFRMEPTDEPEETIVIVEDEDGDVTVEIKRAKE